MLCFLTTVIDQERFVADPTSDSDPTLLILGRVNNLLFLGVHKRTAVRCLKHFKAF